MLTVAFLMAIKPHNVPTLWRQSKSMGLWWIHKRFLRGVVWLVLDFWMLNVPHPHTKVCGFRHRHIDITIFILILTVKSELLSSWLIATQLILSIPLWIAALASQSKIVDTQSLKKYYTLTKWSSGIALAFIYNVIGLLVVR